MKKSLFFVALIGIVMTTLCGCGSKTVKGADGKEYDSYQSACRNQDFVAAYDWIEKNNGSEEDKDYVFNAEMLYLTSLGTEEASNRIIYLLAEYQVPGTPIVESSHYSSYQGDLYQGANQYVEGIARFNKRCDNVIDMAIAQGNEILAKKIINLYKGDINVSDNYKEREYLSIGTPTFFYKSRDNAVRKINKAFGSSDYLDEGEFIPVQINISGPLNGYFKVLEKKYKRIQIESSRDTDCIYVEFERIKKGFPVKNNYDLHLQIEYLDEKDHVVEKNNSEWLPKEIINSSVGDAISLKFYISRKTTANKFRILSQKL